MNFKIIPLGDSALELTIDNSEKGTFAHSELMRMINESSIAGIVDFTPTTSSLGLKYDQETFNLEALRSFLGDINIDFSRSRIKGQLKEIPICYEEKFAIDLGILCSKLGMIPEDVVRIHSSGLYTIDMYGFLPGFPYMSGLDPRLNVSRKKEPSLSIPPGSVAIANGKCGIYPFESPGGWYVLGRTPIKMVDLHSSNPFPFSIGQQLKFKPIDLEEYNEIHARNS